MRFYWPLPDWFICAVVAVLLVALWMACLSRYGY